MTYSESIPIAAKNLTDIWFSPSFPQYRKIVDGEQRLLEDGDTVENCHIVKIDHTDEYKEALQSIIDNHQNNIN